MTLSTGFRQSGYLASLLLFWGGYCGGGFDTSPWPDTNVHHYVYEHGQYVPQYYRYDPYPNYRAFTHNFPPVYRVHNLEYYQGLDYGRPERFGRVDNAFYP